MTRELMRFAVVGAAGHAGHHIRQIDQWGEHLGCELTAVTIRPQDRQPGQVEAFTARGVRVFADGLEMLDALAGEAHGVFIPTSIYTHCELACAALARGLNVYLEKPPAATVQEVDRMLAAVAASGRLCALGFQRIFSDQLARVKSLLAGGSLGRPLRMSCWHGAPRHDAYYARNEWAGQLRCGSAWVLDGPSNNAHAHDIAMMLYLAGPAPRAFAAPATVHAELYHARDITSEDTASIRITTEAGPVLHFVVSHCAETRDVSGSVIECEEGSIDLAARPNCVRRADGRVEPIEPPAAAQPEPPASSPAPPETLANFTAAVRADDPAALKCDLAMGRNFTLAINGAFESAGPPRAIPPQFTARRENERGPWTAVTGMDALLAACGQQSKLFSEASAPWAKPTEPFDLTNYPGFPQRFK